MSAVVNFHDYQDMYTGTFESMKHMYGTKFAKANIPSPQDFYLNALLDPTAFGDMKPNIQSDSHPKEAEQQSHLQEEAWYAAELAYLRMQKPYFRVFPDYAAIFAKTTLDVPLRHFVYPYQSFAIRFQVGSEPRWGNAGVAVLLVSCRTGRQMTEELHGPGSVEDMCKHIPPDKRHVFNANMEANFVTVRISMVYDEQPGHHVDHWFGLSWSNSEAHLDATMADMLHQRGVFDVGFKQDNIMQKAHPWSLDIDRMFEINRHMMSIALSVCFLATGGDKLVEPDVMNPDFASYLAAVNSKDKKTVAALSAKAQRVRNGQPGFVVGRQESLLGRRVEGTRVDGPIGQGQGLTYTHQRKGHVHTFWGGTNRDQLIMKWVAQHTVRGDLPPNPNARIGAHTLDSKATEQQILNQGGSQ